MVLAATMQKEGTKSDPVRKGNSGGRQVKLERDMFLSAYCGGGYATWSVYRSALLVGVTGRQH